MIGIGVTTHNRHKLIATCVKNIRKYTSSPYKLVVVDDASDVPVNIKNVKIYRFEKNMGIAASKNKCLSLLEGCDHYFLFDDDCWPKQTGWEDFYINAATKSKSHHFCFTWEYYDNGEREEYWKVDKIVGINEKYVLHIEGIEPQYFNSWMHDITIRMIKIQMGFPGTIPHRFEYQPEFEIKIHNSCSGALLYFDKECVEKIGGFNTGFGRYGGEHVGFTNRVYNVGLNPIGVFLDVKGSDEYIHSVDKSMGGKNVSLSVVDEKERCVNKVLEDYERISKDYIDYE